MKRSHLDHGLSALQAIELSARETRTVHMEHSDVLAADLLSECDGNNGDGDIDEYWGDDWLVTLHREVV